MSVEEKVKDVFSEKCYINDIQDDNRLREDLMMDSLSLAELMINLEEVFDIIIDTGDLRPAGLVIVSDIVALVKKYMDGDANAV